MPGEIVKQALSQVASTLTVAYAAMVEYPGVPISCSIFMNLAQNSASVGDNVLRGKMHVWAMV